MRDNGYRARLRVHKRTLRNANNSVNAIFIGAPPSEGAAAAEDDEAPKSEAAGSEAPKSEAAGSEAPPASEGGAASEAAPQSEKEQTEPPAEDLPQEDVPEEAEKSQAEEPEKSQVPHLLIENSGLSFLEALSLRKHG